MQHTDHTNQAGAIIGAGLVFIKKMFLSVTMFGFISWASILDASILAGVGAAVGFVVTAALKHISRKIFKPKS